MDVGQLLARLSPQAVNYAAVGGGGQPELTTSDIAAALAFVPKGLGRSVLEAVYWPDGACRTNDLRNAVMGLVMPELSRQLHRLQEAELDLQLTQAAVHWSNRGITHDQQQSIERARRHLESVRSKTWPRRTLKYIPAMTQAIISELSGSMQCDSCGGRGGIDDMGLFVVCTNCKGTGLEPKSNYRRSQLVGFDHKGYERNWKIVYEWIFIRIFKAVNDAALQLYRSLKNENFY